MKEIWRDIPDYIGLYQVSNWGQVKRLKCGREKILKPIKIKGGYLIVNLYRKDIIQKSFAIHRLVWDAFGDIPRNGRTLQVDHKDLNKENNHIDNLQLLNPRENCSKKTFKKEKTSKYIGVCWNKNANKWKSQIVINRKKIGLGYFDSEIEASQAYLKAKENL